jgi:hypothetical protein
MGFRRLWGISPLAGAGALSFACANQDQTTAAPKRGSRASDLRLQSCKRTSECAPVNDDEVLCIRNACVPAAPRQACAGIGCDDPTETCITNFRDLCPDCALKSTCVSWDYCWSPGVHCELDSTTPWSSRPTNATEEAGAEGRSGHPK